MSNIRLMFVVLVQLRHIVRQPKEAMCCGQTLKRAVVTQKQIKIYYESSSGCAISNCKRLHLCLYLWQLQKTINSKKILQVSVQELHNSMVSPLEGGRLKEARDKENDIIISD